MRIEEGKIVSIDYSIYLETGELVDSSEGKSPLKFLYGKGVIFSKLEEELEGLMVGDEKIVTLSPEEAYGELDPYAIKMIPSEEFPPDIQPEVGMILYMKTPDGQTVPFCIKSISDRYVVIDFNHPLAGKTLNIKVTIRNVRDATAMELALGSPTDVD